MTEIRTMIGKKELLKIVPLSDRTIYTMEKEGRFPKRSCLSKRKVAWFLDEVQDWMKRNYAASNSRQIKEAA